MMNLIEVNITQGLNRQKYLRFDKSFSLEEVLPFAIDPIVGKNYKRNKKKGPVQPVEKQYGEHWVKMFSFRYWLFKNKGTKCCTCGIEGDHFHLERGASSNNKTDRLHFNLYATAPDGSEILMTKDHIHPRSKGGGDYLGNFQTMCTICNAEKADKV